MVLPGLHESETAVVSLVSMTVCMSCRLSTKVQRPSRIHSCIYSANFQKHRLHVVFDFGQLVLLRIGPKCKKNCTVNGDESKTAKKIIKRQR